MTVDDLMTQPGADVYYSKAFRDTLEAHMDYLRNTPGLTTDYDVDPQKAEVYDGDLFGFLTFLNIPPYQHWVTMRVMNYFSPLEFGPGVTKIRVPKPSELNMLRQSQLATKTGSITM